MVIMANDVKKKGVSYFDTLFEKFSEIVISVRGKNKYVVVPFEEYEAYRAYKLDTAHEEAMRDIAEGNYHTDTQKHFDTIEKALKDV